jgi:hypothetical protein
MRSVFWVKTRYLKGLPMPFFLSIAMIVLLLSLTTLGLLTISRTVSSSGTILTPDVSIGVYSDSQCTRSLTSISWGSISPGTNVSRTFYVKNTGNVPLTLTMNSSDWSPAVASESMSLEWNRQNYVLNAGQSVSAELRLVVNSNTTGVTTFTVNIVISGSG